MLLSACAGFPTDSSETNSVEETEEAEDTLTRIRQGDKIIIGVRTDSPPFAFLDSDQTKL